MSHPKLPILLFQAEWQTMTSKGFTFHPTAQVLRGSCGSTFQSLRVFLICTSCEGDFAIFCFIQFIKWNESRLNKWIFKYLGEKKLKFWGVTSTWDTKNEEFAKQMAICWLQGKNLKKKKIPVMPWNFKLICMHWGLHTQAQQTITKKNLSVSLVFMHKNVGKVWMSVGTPKKPGTIRFREPVWKVLFWLLLANQGTESVSSTPIKFSPGKCVC